MQAPHSYPPLRGTDGGFTLDSIQRRLPDIVRGITTANPGLPPAAQALLQQLETDMRTNAPLRCLVPAAVDSPDAWPAAWYESYLTASPPLHWLDAPWFFVELWVYRQVQDIMVAAAGGLDPFVPNKTEALEAALVPFLETVVPLHAAALAAGSETAAGETKTAAPADALRALLLRALWGNRADLSLSAGKVETHGDRRGDEDAFLLADHSTAAVAALLTESSSDTLVYIVDNTGLELLCDLALIDACLALCPGLRRVVVHVKPYPIFVSDVTGPSHDVEAHIQALLKLGQGHSRAAPDSTLAAGALLGASLAAHCAAGRLEIAWYPFYASPLPWWEAPAELWTLYTSARAVVVKGDAQYRRLLGDAHWPHTTPWGQAMAYWKDEDTTAARKWTGSLIALRTTKAGVLAGAEADKVAAAAARAPSDWMTSGHYGLVLTA